MKKKNVVCLERAKLVRACVRAREMRNHAKCIPRENRKIKADTEEMEGLSDFMENGDGTPVAVGHGAVVDEGAPWIWWIGFNAMIGIML